MQLKKTLLFYITFFFLCSHQLAQVHAGKINPDIIKDLSPITGYIVKKQLPNTLIIDLDDHDGITTGNLFSVITEKESLTHPVTDKIIGKLNETKACLRITQIRKGYAFSEIIYTHQKTIIQPGDRVIRYDQIPAHFIDRSGNGKHIYTALLKQLPHFKWHVYDNPLSTPTLTQKTPHPKLILINETRGLEVRDNNDRLIHYYPKNEIYLSSVLPIDQYGHIQENMYDTINIVGKVEGTILAADFIVDDNQLYMASVTKNQVEIFHINTHKIESVVKKQLPIQHHPIQIHWWRPSSIANPHLTITYWHEQDIESILFVFAQQKIKMLAYGINFHIAAYDQNHDGNPETLLGQPMDRDTFWDNRVYRLAYFDHALRLVKRFRAPYSFSVYGSTIGDLTGDGYLETAWINDGVLRIYNGNTFLYKTYVGNTPGQRISYDVDPMVKKSLFRNVSIYPRPIINDLNQDKLPELYALHSERPLLNQLGFQSQALRSWIKCIQYQNKMFYSRRISRIFNTNIQAFTIYNGSFFVIMGLDDHDAETSYTKVVCWDY